MKILKHILSAAALLVLAAACNHDPDELVLPESDLSISRPNKVVVNGLTIDEDFTLVWSAVRFAAPGAVEYTVDVRSAFTDLPAGAQMHDDYTMLGTTQATHFTCKNSELFAAVGISRTGNYDLEFCITATSASGEIKRKSVVVPFEYSKVTYLWVPGDYQDWSFSGKISRLLQGDDNIFRGFVQLPEGGEFKFTSQPDFDAGTNYGPGDEEGVLNTEGSAGNLSAAAGLYYVEVDVEALTYVMLPLESVSLIGEGVGSWEEDVEMIYDAAARTWVGFADAVAGKEYKIRFNKMWDIEVGDATYNCSLGGSAADLQIASNDNLAVEGEGGITAFTLSIFDYPYTISESDVEENDDELYLVSSVDDWNYLKAPKLSSLGENKFYGLVNFVGATSPEVLFSRLQTPLSTRFGGTAAALESFAGGAEATPIAAEAGLRFYAVDLSGETKALYDTEITDAAVVPAQEGAAPIAMTADGAGKWTLTHEFDATGKFSIALNGGKIACGGTDYPAVLGGSCTGLVLGGGALNMTKGEHELVLDLTASAMTLAIDGEVADLQLYPATLGVTGNFGDINWSETAAPQLWGNVETGSYWGYLSMYGTADFGFKFIYGTPTTWVAGKTVEDSETEFVLGAGDNMTIAGGLYRWDVNLDAMTAKATPLTKVGLVGDGVGSWDDDVELVRDVADGLYKAAGVVCTKGEFKIRFNGAWDYSLGGDPENLTDDNAGNIAIEAGTYDFALDLTHTPYKITVTAAE